MKTSDDLARKNYMSRQDFDIGDLVKFSIPYATDGPDMDSLGMITEAKLINRYTEDNQRERKWHIDEYHCKLKLSDGNHRWVRAKYLKMVSKAKFSKFS